MRADGWMMRSRRWGRMAAKSSSRSIRSGRLAFARLSSTAKAIELHCTRLSFRIFNRGLVRVKTMRETLQAAGHKAEIKEFKAGTRAAVEVRAPSAGLYVMFVKKEFCDKPIPPPEKK